MSAVHSGARLAMRVNKIVFLIAQVRLALGQHVQ